MPLNIPLHPPGYYFCITARTMYKISNWSVGCFNFYLFCISFKISVQNHSFSFVCSYQKGQSSHIYFEYWQIPQLELLSTCSACKILSISMPDPFQHCLLPIYGSLKALNRASSTDQKIRRWLFFILSPSIFSIIIQLKIKPKFPCQFHTDMNECYH